MTVKERLVAGIHHQKDALDSLATLLQSKSQLTQRDCGLYDVATREIEKSLKKLRRLALDELIKEITKQQHYTVNREEILE